MDKLDDIVNENSNIIQNLMKPTDVKNNTYVSFGKEIYDKNPKYKIADHVRISKHKNILLKDTLEIGRKKFL